MRIKKLLAAMTAFSVLASAAMPVYADEANPFPLQGTFPYTMVTRESVDAKLAEGWAFVGDLYAEVGMAVPFQNNEEWVQVNQFKSSVAADINSGKILITLAGLTPVPDGYSGSGLTAEEEAVKAEVVKYLDSFDWKQATDYEKAAYTAEYIASRCVYMPSDGGNMAANNSYACLVNGQSMCDGFAQSYHLLTRAAGLKSVYISDITRGHAWNYVLIDNVWYEMDVTFVAGSGNHQARTKEYLSRPATDTARYIWAEKGLELEYDHTIPNQPAY